MPLYGWICSHQKKGIDFKSKTTFLMTDEVEFFEVFCVAILSWCHLAVIFPPCLFLIPVFSQEKNYSQLEINF
jgi:hypothetical protein